MKETCKHRVGKHKTNEVSMPKAYCAFVPIRYASKV